MSGKPRTTPSPEWPDAKVEQLRALVAEGLSCPKIAAIMKLNRNQVIGKIHRLRLRSEHPIIAVKLERPKRVRTYRPVTPKPVAEKPASVVVEPEPKAQALSTEASVTLLEILPHQCHWVIVDAPQSRMDHALMCGQPCDGNVYCAEHRRAAFVPCPPRRNRPFVVAA